MHPRGRWWRRQCLLRRLLQRRRNGLSRRQIEVAWLHASATAETIEDWILELDRDSIAQQVFLAMGIGLISIKRAQWGLAKRSLCQVRSNLKLMTQEAVRPPSTELEQQILALVNEAISEVDIGARAKGLDLNANAQIRLACSP